MSLYDSEINALNVEMIILFVQGTNPPLKSTFEPCGHKWWQVGLQHVWLRHVQPTALQSRQVETQPNTC